MDVLIGQNMAQGGENDPVSDGDQKSFSRDVIEASRKVPVLVDFWATWCAPCKQLTPLLEKTVRSAGGRIKLVKIDVDQNRGLVQQLAMQGLPVQSLPTVVAIWKGALVDSISGALPESGVKQFVSDVLKAAGSSLPGADLLTQAKAALQEEHYETALGLFSEILGSEPENPDAWGGILRSLIAMGQIEEATAFLAEAPAAIAQHPAIESARTAMQVVMEGRAAVGQIAGLQSRLAADEDDHDARFELAKALNAGDQRAEAADALLYIIKKDRAWRDDGARQELLKFFDAWGIEDPASIAARRKLSALLFR